MPATVQDLLAVPAARRTAMEQLVAELGRAKRVAISTHMNADGDGCGSEAALSRILAARGIDSWIVNPTPWPPMFTFLLGTDVKERTREGAAALAGADTLVVLDISDVKRLGVLADTVRRMTVPKLVIDHHIPSDEPPGGVVLSDTSACATGELVFDLATTLGIEITEPIARALYAAILTDTGGFRFSNTTPRAHAIAAQLLAAGVEPEDMYRRIYASVPLARIMLLRDALATLEVDAPRGLAWISVPAGALERYGLQSEDLDGLVEHPRSIAGTRLALFFRDLGHGKVKVSFRSTGDVDVNRFARQFGGGGHAKAAGALVPGRLDEVRTRLVQLAQEYVEEQAPAAE
jgi:phosphoesterase RecJ-like protein